LAVLPFLGAGETQKSKGRYQDTVKQALYFLMRRQAANGDLSAGTGHQMYAHALGTLALCEAYGMTGDPALKRAAQRGLDYIVKAQHSAGGFRYSPGQAGDTSVTGWCLQAMQSGKLAGLSVPADTFYKVSSFLDTMQTQNGAAYGYLGPGASVNLTPVGLLCRYYISKWGPGNAGLAEGVDGLGKRPPAKAPAKPDMYYYYYATQVVHFADGPEWKDWNEGKEQNGRRTGGMRDWLVNIQEKKEGPNHGSWEADGAIIGGSCGRIGTTALSLLTLEVYYRHLPLYKRDNAGGAALAGVK
jgi:hypothetical protein